MIIGIVGCGGIAKAHIRALSLIRDMDGLILYDANKESANRLREMSKIPAVVSGNISDLARQSDGFIVCTPNNLHLPVIAEVLNHKFIPCVCEKPLASDFTSARRISEITHPSSIVSFNYRYNLIVKKILDLIKRESLGKLNYFSAEFNKSSAITRNHITWRDSSQQRNSSGALGDLSCHLLDLFCALSSQRISLDSLKISKGTRIKTKSDGAVEVDDNGYVFGTGDQGTVFRIKASKAEREASLGFHLNLAFDEGEIFYSTQSPKNLSLHRFGDMEVYEVPIDDQRLLPDPEKELPFWSDSFFYMLKEWCEEVKGGATGERLPRISSGLHVQEVIEAF
jgi:glucose-6-phosphate 3-dehydrogenase